MFIRRTQTRTAPTGETCFTHRLVRSERIASKVRQRTLLNLGRHFETEPEDWPALCRRIDELLCGQLAMDSEVPPALESQAQRITAQLLARERADEREPVRGWPARARNAPPGAGWANEAPWGSCREWTSRPWGRCNSIAHPMR